MTKGPEEKYCFECGEIIRAIAEICPKCGVRQPDIKLTQVNIELETHKKKSVAAILALIFGSIGVHHFYLGQSGIGLFYLLFCWTGLPLVLGVIEGIGIAMMKEESFLKKYPGPAWSKTI